MGPNEKIVLDASQGAHVAAAALVVWCLIQVSKSPLIPVDFLPRQRPFVALLLGQAYAALEAIVFGTPWGMALVMGIVSTTMAIGGQEIGSAAKGSSPPPGAGAAVLLFLALGGAGTGCAAVEGFKDIAHASRDVLLVAEPCLSAKAMLEEAKCDGDHACVQGVKEKWRPIGDAIDLIHFRWCEIAPTSEGCEPEAPAAPAPTPKPAEKGAPQS